jgi:shikimate kinase
MDKNIAFIGFMGSGKTTIGKRVSMILKREFIDMDDFLVNREGMSINDIFATKGEAYFRKLESDLCKRFETPKGKIIATGGGVIKSPENIKSIKKGSIIIYLKSTPEKINSNLQHDNSRPLLAVEDKLGKIREILAERQPIYEKYADYTIDVSDGNVEESIQSVLDIANKG